MKTQIMSLQSQVSASPKNRIKMSRVPECLYLLPGRAAVQQRDALVDQALVGATVLAEDLLHRQAVLKHLHLFLLLQRHLQPLLSLQDLVLQRRLQLLQSRQRIQSVSSCSYFFDGEHRPSRRITTSMSCVSDAGMGMCWSRQDGSLGVNTCPLPSNTGSSCRLTHNMWLCFLFSSVRWSRTAATACDTAGLRSGKYPA